MARKSTGEYPPNWKEIATAVKDEHGWQCIRCGHPHDPASGHTLTVHHADMCPPNCSWWNLLCLCQKCHLVIQSKVVMERIWYLPHSEWFKPFVAGYYASVYGLLTDKEFVLAHVDELIALGQSPVLNDLSDAGDFVQAVKAAALRTGKTSEQAAQEFENSIASNQARRDEAYAELAQAWPDLPEISGGVDLFAERYGQPTGE